MKETFYLEHKIALLCDKRSRYETVSWEEMMEYHFADLTARTGVLVRSPVSVPPVEIEHRTFEDLLEEILRVNGWGPS